MRSHRFIITVLILAGAAFLAHQARHTPTQEESPPDQAGEPRRQTADSASGPTTPSAAGPTGDSTEPRITEEDTEKARSLRAEYSKLSKLDDAGTIDEGQRYRLVNLPNDFTQLPEELQPTISEFGEMAFRSESIFRAVPDWAHLAPSARKIALSNLAKEIHEPHTEEERHTAVTRVLEHAEEGISRYSDSPEYGWFLLYRHLANRLLSQWDSLSDDLERALVIAIQAEPLDSQLAARTWIEKANLYIDYGTADLARSFLEQAKVHAAQSSDLRPTILSLDVRISLVAGQWRRALRALTDSADDFLAPPAMLENWRMKAQIRSREEELGFLPAPRGSLSQTDATKERSAPSPQHARTIDPELERLYAALPLAASHPQVPPTDRAGSIWWTVMYLLKHGRTDEAGQLLLKQGDPWAPGARPLLPEDAMLLAARAHLLLCRFESGAASIDEIHDLLPTLEEALSRQIERWSAAPLLKGGLGRLHLGSDRQILRDLILLRLAAATSPEDREQAANQAFSDLLRMQQSATLARALGVPSATWDDIRTTLTSPKNGLLAYIPAGYIPLLLIADDSQIRVVRLEGLHSPAITRLDLDIHQLMAIPSGMDRNEFVGRSVGKVGDIMRRLGAFLLPPDAAEMIGRWESFTVCCLDDLGRWPIEGAVVNGNALGVSHAIRHLPALSIGAHLAEIETPESANGSVTIVGPAPKNQHEEAGLAPIPLSPETAKQWFGTGTRLSTFIDVQATLSQARKANRSNAQSLILVGHGVDGDGIASTTAIQLRPADEDDAGRIDSTQLDLWRDAGWVAPTTVFLASCGSAAGAARSGDQGSQHLAGSFLLAGARTVVASPWDLEIDSTLEMLELAAPKSATGEDPARAMQMARAEIYRRGFGHPALIAAWRVIGPPR